MKIIFIWESKKQFNTLDTIILEEKPLHIFESIITYKLMEQSKSRQIRLRPYFFEKKHETEHNGNWRLFWACKHMVVISLRNFSDQNFAPLQEIFEELLVTLFKSIFSLKQKKCSSSRICVWNLFDRYSTHRQQLEQNFINIENLVSKSEKNFLK